MLFSTALGIFLGFWSLLYLVDHYFRSRSFNAYLKFVEKTGLIVTPFQLRLYTSKFQRYINSCSILKTPRVRRFLNVWFTLGVVATIGTMLGITALLSRTLVDEFFSMKHYFFPKTSVATNGPTSASTALLTTRRQSDFQETSKSSGLIPVVPGVNLPLSEIPFFLSVLVLAGVVHELGHAVSAVNENVGVNGFGVFLLAIYPGAFTEIENDGLYAVSVFRKLRIYCAGVWNNIALAVVGLALLKALPTLLGPAYMSGKGVAVRSVRPDSSLIGPAGLTAGHVIYGLNYCKVYDEAFWTRCLYSLRRTNYGYCVPRREVTANDADRVLNVFGELQCCSTNTSQTHLCFYYKATYNETALEHAFRYSCLPARYATDHYVCNNSLPCSGRTYCVYPALFNSTKLLRFFIANQSKPVLFIGYLNEVRPYRIHSWDK